MFFKVEEEVTLLRGDSVCVAYGKDFEVPLWEIFPLGPVPKLITILSER